MTDVHLSVSINMTVVRNGRLNRLYFTVQPNPKSSIQKFAQIKIFPLNFHVEILKNIY